MFFRQLRHDASRDSPPFSCLIDREKDKKQARLLLEVAEFRFLKRRCLVFVPCFCQDIEYEMYPNTIPYEYLV